MTVEHLEVVVEDLSMEAALRLLLPKITSVETFEIYPHQCKGDLLLRLPQRFQGYKRRIQNDPWFRDHCRIVVIVDRDDDDCHLLKQRLEEMAEAAGLTTRAHARSGLYIVVNRIAVEELEAWYFGDWQAVRQAFPRVPATVPYQAKYRRPDDIAGGTSEALERLLQRAGYFSGGLRKVEMARTLAYHMVPERNVSPSFRALRDALLEMSAP